MSSPSIIIIGAGIGGLTLARTLLLHDLHIEVYEAQAHLQAPGGGLIVPPNSARILERLGLRSVFQNGVSLRRMQIIDAVNGQALYVRDQHEVERQQGRGLWAVSRSVLQAGLLEKLPPEVLSLQHRLDTVQERGHESYLSFTNRRHVIGDLIVGADGAQSRTREILFPHVQLQPTGQTAVRGVLAARLPARYEQSFTEFWGVGQRFTCFPINDREVYWHAVLKSGDVSPTVTIPQLAQAYESFPAPVQALIQETPEAAMIVTPLRDLSPLPEWTKGNVVLLGDAAHATSPNLGQGAAQAIEDAATLADLIATESDVHQAARRFQQRREHVANAVVARSRQMGQLGQVGGAGRWFRNMTLKVNPDLARSRIEAFYDER
ncbi:FAD-dependent monooxygenase [Deinococcus fonticola]|uniref:FAD-dependent monooxygenase n=1 Tax=Deinococcus fonticola TaxID=2528713 RepID=UPI0014319320|nr:FAD-dependent monooxygenase [Deinococcus fonticola]